MSELVQQSRRAEHIGFDVVLLPDHLGHHAPLPTLVALAQAAPSVRVGNLVLNACFYRPTLLARDLASVDAAVGGRLEIGLGAGWVEAEFLATGLPFPTPGARVSLLTEHIIQIRQLLSSSDYVPAPTQSPPPILAGGVGDRLLAMAAVHADIVAIACAGGESELAERVNYVKMHAGPRIDQIELAFSFFHVSIDDSTDPLSQRGSAAGADQELPQPVAVLTGSVSEAAERIRRMHRELGISYFTFNKTPDISWETLEKLIAAVK
jgi:probable F420-dependent oxidoreductase